MATMDAILDKLLALRTQKPGVSANLSRDEIEYLCKTVKQIFLDQPTLLELKAPMTVCGDTHGQFHDVLRLFEVCKYPPETNFLFLGDYVDRGMQSIETVCLLFAFKIKYPKNFFMLRGNHECSYINRLYGFFDECKRYYDESLWRLFGDVFNCLPIAAIIDEKIFCVHGGISPELRSLDDIRRIKRPCEIPEDGLLCDLLWSDPDPMVEMWDENDRGISHCFGEAPVDEFLDKFQFDLVCRGHQVVSNGYEFPYGQNMGLVTVFSAPNYCYEYDNKGAVMHINSDLVCSFSLIEARRWDEEYYVGPRPGTPPRSGSENQMDVGSFHLF